MHTIVVLGSGPAAAPIIRQTMRTVVLPVNEYKLVVVSPSTSYYWPVAVPRAVVPGQLSTDKIAYPLESHFKSYPSNKFEFVLGKAEHLDPNAKTVDVGLNDGGKRLLSYNTLIVATGSTPRDDFPWKTLGTTERTEQRLQEIRDEVQNAKTIVVAGGGMSGSETAGELGFEYAQYGKKEVIFVYSGSLPLDTYLKESVRKSAKKELDKLKVKSMPSTTVVSATKNGGQYTIELRAKDGTTKTLTAQAYIPAMGMTPNTSFAPAQMLNQDGYLKTNNYLQAVGHQDIFVVGDAGDLQRSSLGFAYDQVHHLVKTLPEYFQTGKAVTFAANDQVQAAVTLGRSRAVGQFGTHSLPSLMIWWLKGRHLGTDVAGNLASGKKTSRVVFEK